MTQLQAILDEHGMSISALAKQLGVSRPAVSQWASGKAKIPIGRIGEITDALDLSPSALSGQTQRMEFIPDTIFAWLLMDGGMLSHIGDDWADRVCIVAETLDVECHVLLKWGQEATMPVGIAKAFMAAYLPGVNPVIMAAVVAGNRLSEVLAVRKTVKDALGDDTWAVLQERVEAERLAWESFTEIEVRSLLDDGRKVPTLIAQWETAAHVARSSSVS